MSSKLPRIGIGTNADDGTGDTMRNAGQKFNDAMTAIETGAGVMVPSFASIATMDVPTAQQMIVTQGYNVPGDGGGAIYVLSHNGVAASSALATANNRCCSVSTDGRFWMLLPIEDAISVAQVGLLTSVTNAQPIIQAAIIYAEAIAVPAVRFPSGNFQVYTPLRTDADDNIRTGITGVPLTIRKAITLIAGGSGTVLRRRKRDGSDPSVYAGTQMLAKNANNNGQPMPWRGGMFLLVGSTGTSAPTDRTQVGGLTLRGKWDIDGGIPMSGSARSGPCLFSSDQPGQSGATPSYYELKGDGSGDGWDITDKMIWGQNNTWTGDVTLDGDIRMGGFRGELLYQGGEKAGSVYQFGRLELHDTDGDGWNPEPITTASGKPGLLHMEYVWIHDCFQALEANAGWNGWIGTLIVEDCYRSSGLDAGTFPGTTNGTDEGTSTPTFVIDTWIGRRCMYILVLQNTHIKQALLTDCRVYFGLFNSYCRNSRIDYCEVMADRMNIDDAVLYSPNGSAAGSKLLHHCQIGHLHVGRTPHAIANNFSVSNPVGWYASLGDGCIIHKLTGEALNFPFSRAPGGVVDYQVGFFDFSGLNVTSEFGNVQNIDTTPQLALNGPFKGLLTSVNTAGLYQYSLPSMGGKLPKGSRITTKNLMNGQPIVMAVQPGNVRSNQLLLQSTVSQEMSFVADNSGLFLPTSPPIAILGQMSVTWPSIAAGATSPEQTITINGVDPDAGLFASVSQYGLGLDTTIFTTNVRISAKNTVAVSVTNRSTSAQTPPQQPVLVKVVGG